MKTTFVQTLLGHFNKLDWFVGGAFLVVGLYVQNWWIVAGGIVGLLSAYYQPALYLKNKLEQKLLAKGAATSDNAITVAEEAFYANFNMDDDAQPRANKGGSFEIWGVAHNQLCAGCVGVFTPSEREAGPKLEMLRRPYY